MSNVAILGVELWVFEAVTAYFGVLVVDGIDEDEDDGDGDHRDGHQSGYEGKIVLWNEVKQETCQGLAVLKKNVRKCMCLYLSCFVTSSHLSSFLFFPFNIMHALF